MELYIRRNSALGDNVNHVPESGAAEVDTAVLDGEKSVVLAPRHISPRSELGPALPYYDAPGTHYLPVKPLHAQSLCVAVAPFLSCVPR